MRLTHLAEMALCVRKVVWNKTKKKNCIIFRYLYNIYTKFFFSETHSLYAIILIFYYTFNRQIIRSPDTRLWAFFFCVGDGSQIYDLNRVFNVSVSHNILLIINNIILCYGALLYRCSSVLKGGGGCIAIVVFIPYGTI